MAARTDNAPNEPKLGALEEACLSVIIENFGRFCETYNDPNNSVPKRNWEFLARRFSETLFCRLKHDSKLKPEHLDFLINPHLKELDLVGINGWLLPDVINKLKTKGNNVLTFKSRSEDVEAILLEPLMSALSRVENIHFHCSNSSRICMAIKKHCPFVKVLNFKLQEKDSTKKHFVNPFDIHAGYNNTSLNNDYISSVIKHCPYLEFLDYGDIVGVLHKMRKIDIHFVKVLETVSLKKYKKYNLRNLSSVGQNYDLLDAMEVCTIFCPYVSSLYIDNLKSDDELEKCLHFPCLEDVTFKKMSSITPNSFNQFLKLRGCNLMTLDLPYEQCFSILTLMETCPKLKLLKLRGAGYHTFTENSEMPINACLPHLETLVFSQADFEYQGDVDIFKFILSTVKAIRRISLFGSIGLTKEFVSRLDLNYIRELDVSSSDIEMCSLKYLLLNSNLQALYMEECRNISFEEYEILKSCSSMDPETVAKLKCQWSLTGNPWLRQKYTSTGELRFGEFRCGNSFLNFEYDST